jgi:diguanylate cyclase (GGDEF)-like protein
MSYPLDPCYLPEIDAALSSTGLLPKLSPRIAEIFYANGEGRRRASNRNVMLLLIVMFDLYWFAQRQSTPDIVLLSGVLRFGLFTPFALALYFIDPPQRIYDLYLLAVGLGACFITIFLCLSTTAMAPPEIYGAPLILLYTSVLVRLRLPIMAANVIVSTAAYIAGVLACPMLRHSATGTFIFLQIAVAAAVITFNIGIERKDRQIFLLTWNERIRRSLIAEQNHGLLRETQTDALTLLANRRCFDETFSMEWLNAHASGSPISLIMIDIDHFKKFNDFYGHVVGDDCLRRIAGVLRDETRPADLVARLGGEEFAVILAGSDEASTLAIAERLRGAVERLALPHEGMGAGAIVSISLGMATARPGNALHARNLIEEADNNLYTAKHTGRNRVASGPVAALAWRNTVRTMGSDDGVTF